MTSSTGLLRLSSVFVFVVWSHSGRKVLQDLNNQNDDRIGVLEEMVKDAQFQATEAERKYEEVG